MMIPPYQDAVELPGLIRGAEARGVRDLSEDLIGGVAVCVCVCGV
jgi:hypothetical protein